MRRGWVRVVVTAVVLAGAGVVGPPLGAPAASEEPEPAPVTISIGDVTLVEGFHSRQVARLNITLSEPQPVDTLVSWHTSDLTATAPDDYIARSRTTRIRAGRTTAVAPVPVVADSEPEPDEVFAVVISGTDNPDVALGRHTGNVTIINDGIDAPSEPPGIYLGDVALMEGNQGRQVARVPITLSHPQPVDTIVEWHTSDGTAAAPDDYRARDRRTRIRAGQTKALARVPVFGDREAEDDETFTVVATGTNNPAIEIPRYYGTVTIIDDDTPRPERTVPHDYTGDGKADRVWVDPEGVWWIEGQDDPLWIGPRVDENDGFWPLPGDYDGNGRWEPAVLISGGFWVTAGWAGTLHLPHPEGPYWFSPVPGDYNGDGHTQPAFFDHNTADWLIHGQEPVQFGIPGDPSDPFSDASVPVPADYDGDGTTDLAVYEPLEGAWRLHGQADPIVWGPGVPLPADWTGDGHADVAVLDIRDSSVSVFGVGVIGVIPGDGGFPTPADYTGDDVADLSGIDGHGSGYQWHTVGLPTIELGQLAGFNHRPELIVSYLRLIFIAQCLFDPECDLPQPTPPAAAYDFTGDGQADRVWVDKQGVWWMEGADELFWDPQPEFPWSVTPAAGDYDGDGTWEPAIVTHDGVWITPDDSVSFPFPEANVADGVPTPADFDGDGTTDRAWFSTATATWYVEGHDPVVFGEPATEIIDPLWAPIPTSFDVPVPADYDGDGSAELAVYNPWSNRWRVQDIDGLEEIVLGKPGDQPVPADYDGDGRAEIAVLEQHTGVWTAHGLGHIATTFAGEEIDLAVAVDLSGDGQVQPSHLDYDRRWHALDLPVLTFAEAVLPAVVPAGVLANRIRLWFIKRSWLWPGCDEIDIICDGPE